MAKSRNILIVESGSTKADWVAISKGQSRSWQSEGLNALVFGDIFFTKLKGAIELGDINKELHWEVFFYGAGCTSSKVKSFVSDSLNQIVNCESIAVENDLLAAAKATCKDESGIVGILGTGSALGYFDGAQFVDYRMSGGYLIGDEGSAFKIGKALIKRYIRSDFDKDELAIIAGKIKLDSKALVSEIYKQEKPNYYLASFAPLIESLSKESRQLILNKVFEEFIFERVLKQEKITELPIHLVGSVAWHHQEFLKTKFKEQGLEIKTVIKSPINNLVKYHLKEDKI